jgi:hypothetical protein
MGYQIMGRLMDKKFARKKCFLSTYLHLAWIGGF